MRQALGRLRVPALALIIGSLGVAVTFLVAAVWNGVLMGLVIANPGGGSSNDAIPAVIMLGIGLIFNLGSIAVPIAAAYGAVRMLRGQGLGWAMGGPIALIVWATIHSFLLMYSAPGLGCLLMPVEFTVSVIAGTWALVALGQEKNRRVFKDLEDFPELLQASSAVD